MTCATCLILGLDRCSPRVCHVATRVRWECASMLLMCVHGPGYQLNRLLHTCRRCGQLLLDVARLGSSDAGCVDFWGRQARAWADRRGKLKQTKFVHHKHLITSTSRDEPLRQLGFLFDHGQPFRPMQKHEKCEYKQWLTGFSNKLGESEIAGWRLVVLIRQVTCLLDA